jgi:hypothetical protein
VNLPYIDKRIRHRYTLVRWQTVHTTLSQICGYLRRSIRNDPLRVSIAKSLLLREGRKYQLNFICMALTRPTTSCSTIEILRVELLRFKRHFPTAKFSVVFRRPQRRARSVCMRKLFREWTTCITPVLENRYKFMDIGHIFGATCYIRPSSRKFCKSTLHETIYSACISRWIGVAPVRILSNTITSAT